MNEKINTKLEFPNELDLKGYTVNPEQQTDATKYRLAGVVVHYGTAEFGHYFSYIDIKR
jgi:ubiquitin carboxyl-terminal hydrolase 34